MFGWNGDSYENSSSQFKVIACVWDVSNHWISKLIQQEKDINEKT